MKYNRMKYLLRHAVVVHGRDLGTLALFNQRGVDVDLVRAQRVHAREHAHARVLAAVDLHVLGVGGVLRAGRDGQLRALRLDLCLFFFWGGGQLKK